MIHHDQYPTRNPKRQTPACALVKSISARVRRVLATARNRQRHAIVQARSMAWRSTAAIQDERAVNLISTHAVAQKRSHSSGRRVRLLPPRPLLEGVRDAQEDRRGLAVASKYHSQVVVRAVPPSRLTSRSIAVTAPLNRVTRVVTDVESLMR